MKNLYGTIMINKEITEKGQKIIENINYYKLKDEKYGIEIVRENEQKNKVEIKGITNITEDEDAINHILNLLVNKEVMPSSEDIIEDLVKQYA